MENDKKTEEIKNKRKSLKRKSFNKQEVEVLISQKKVLEKGVVLYDFLGEYEEEIKQALQGDEIEIVETTPNERSIIILKGEIGTIPTDYITINEKTLKKRMTIFIKKNKESKGKIEGPLMNKDKALLYITAQIKTFLTCQELKKYMKKKEFSNTVQRNKLIKEFIQTEETYVKFLKQLITEYYLPLRKSVSEDKSIDLEEKEIMDIFGNIKDISVLNEKLLEELKEEYKKFPTCYITNVLKKYLKQFSILYAFYVNNFPFGSEQLKTLSKKNKNLQLFLEFKQKVSKLNNINFYLIMPVQSKIFIIYNSKGLPRYKMLLTDTLKNTSQEHLEYETLKETLNKIGEIASKINEIKKITDNQNFKKDLQQQLKGKYQISLDVNREFIRENTNLKFTFSDFGIDSEPYKIVILNDMFILYELQKKKKIFLFFLIFTKILEKNKNEMKLVLEVLYNNNKSLITFQFPLIVDLDDINEILENLINSQNINILAKSIITDDFLLEAYKRAEMVSHISIAQQNFIFSESILKQAQKEKLKMELIYKNTNKKLEEAKLIYEELLKKAEEEKNEILELDKEFKTNLKNTELIIEKMNEIIDDSIDFDQKFKSIFQEEDAYKNCFGDYLPNEQQLKSLIPELDFENFGPPKRPEYRKSNDETSDTNKKIIKLLNFKKNKKNEDIVEINSNEFSKSPKKDGDYLVVEEKKKISFHNILKRKSFDSKEDSKRKSGLTGLTKKN